MTRITSVAENQLLLPSGKLITFNDEQFQGLGKIRDWLKNSENKNIFTLAGYAGTGKSSCIKKVLDKYRGGVVVSAPTHKAKRVIIKTTKKDGQTLHGLLGLRPDVLLENFNPNSPQFNPIAIPKITDYNLVVIDEASMINQDLYNLILEQVEGSRTKVLFMGDPAQIPPVGEKESVVFYQNQTDKIFHQLTKIERQDDGNPLMLYYDALRNNLTDIDGGIKRISNINDLGEGILFTVRKKEFRRAVLEQYSSDEFKKDTDFCKLIAWRNDTVKAANQVIRKELLEATNDVVEIGDLLMGYRTISAEDFRYNIIENSGDYRVVDKSGLEENAYGIMGYQVKLAETLDRGQYQYQDVFIIDINDHQNFHLYGQMHDFFKDMAFADKKQWKKYYEFRRHNILMKDIITYQNGRERPDKEKIVKDMDYGYALTAHKSQGSTYREVFVMENDINNNWLVRERNQIKYVALTRPTHRATVLTTKIDE
ncbi:MAG: ATP-dependent DNA helicase [bacterium]